MFSSFFPSGSPSLFNCLRFRTWVFLIAFSLYFLWLTIIFWQLLFSISVSFSLKFSCHFFWRGKIKGFISINKFLFYNFKPRYDLLNGSFLLFFRKISLSIGMCLSIILYVFSQFSTTRCKWHFVRLKDRDEDTLEIQLWVFSLKFCIPLNFINHWSQLELLQTVGASFGLHRWLELKCEFLKMYLKHWHNLYLCGFFIGEIDMENLKNFGGYFGIHPLIAYYFFENWMLRIRCFFRAAVFEKLDHSENFSRISE